MEKISYNVKEAAKALGIGRTTLYKLIEQGRLDPKKIGKRTVFRAEDLRQLLESHSD